LSEIELPDSLGYTAEHEWIAAAPGSDAPAGPVRVGISAIAVEALGEIVYVDLPEVGAAVTAGEPCGEIESTKSVSELFSPATGTIAEVNTALVDDPAVVGTDPYGEGWLFAVEVTALGELMTAEAYRAANAEDA
jgi:glycine cleavage system H protein